MKFPRERDLEDYIWTDVTRLYRHFRPLARQFHVPNGIIDILTYTANGDLWVVELKRNEIQKDDLIQVSRYGVDIYEIAYSIVESMGIYQTFGMPTIRKMVVGYDISPKYQAICAYLDIWGVTYNHFPEFRVVATPGGPEASTHDIALSATFDNYRALLRKLAQEQ